MSAIQKLDDALKRFEWCDRLLGAPEIARCIVCRKPAKPPFRGY